MVWLTKPNSEERKAWPVLSSRAEPPSTRPLAARYSVSWDARARGLTPGSCTGETRLKVRPVPSTGDRAEAENELRYSSGPVVEGTEATRLTEASEVAPKRLLKTRVPVPLNSTTAEPAVVVVTPAAL